MKKESSKERKLTSAIAAGSITMALVSLVASIEYLGNDDPTGWLFVVILIFSASVFGYVRQD